MRTRVSFSDYVRKHWFLAATLSCVFLAGLLPGLGSKDGPLKTEYTVKYGAVILIFLISGLTLKTDSILYTFQQYELHTFIQCFTFVFIPFATSVLATVLASFGVGEWILKGLITVSCMPPPVSSAVILSRAAQGNEVAAIFNSVLGSFLGIVITPILLLLNLGATTIVPLSATLLQLTVTVLMPLLAGQVARNVFDFRTRSLPLNTISQCALLFVIYTTFCDTFQTHDTYLSAVDVLTTIFLVFAMQASFIFLSYTVAKRLKYFAASDIITIIFCSTHKSLTLGIPILKIMFHGFSHLSQISLPLLVYHPTQIILGSLLTAQLKDWVQSQKHFRQPV